jgi:hypothetical protein
MIIKNGTTIVHFLDSAEKAPNETNSVIILCRVSPLIYYFLKFNIEDVSTTGKRDAAREKRLLRTTVLCHYSQAAMALRVVFEILGQIVGGGVSTATERYIIHAW